MPKTNVKKKLGFIIHHVDREEFALRYPMWVDDIIDNYEEPLFFLSKLANYEVVASTSLHGCVFCHSYGIPVAPFVLTENVIGGDFKFQDYYSSYGIDIRTRNCFVTDEEKILKIVKSTPQPSFDQVIALQDGQLLCIENVCQDLLVKNQACSKKILLITETIFCDNETNCEILDLYLQRFFLTIRSYSHATRSDFDHVFIIYISSDKIYYRGKIEDYCSTLGAGDNGFLYKIIIYEHPAQGYSVNPLAHIDLIKNPNKGPILRDKLFGSVNFNFCFKSYDCIVRAAIDDDDIIPTWHLDNIIQVAKKAAKHWSEGVIGVGFVNSYLVYFLDNIIEVDFVTLRRAINGNKFYIFKDFNKINAFSPWSIPDQLDDEIHDRVLRKTGVRLTLVNNSLPGIFYLRRGSNLSNYRKDSVVEKLILKKSLKNISDIFYFEKEDKIITSNDNFFVPKVGLKVMANIIGKLICFTSNFDRFSEDGNKVSYYLYCDGVKISQISYGTQNSGKFFIDDQKKIYRIKAFLRKIDTIIDTYSTPQIKHK